MNGWGDTWRSADDAKLFTFINVKVLRFAVPLDMSKALLCLKAPGLRAFVFDNNGVEMKTTVEHWWNGTGEKRSTGGRTCPSGTMPPDVRLGHVFLKVLRLPRVCMPQHVVITRRMLNYARSALKSPRQCPLVLLVKVAWRQARASRIEGGIVLRGEC